MIGSGLWQSVVARVNAVKAAYLDATTVGNGAGAVGFLYATAYVGNTIGAWLKGLAGAAGATFIGWVQVGTNPLTRTLQDKVRDTIAIDDFKNASGAAPGLGLDDTQSWNNAINAVIKNGGFGTIELQAGKVYNITGPITIDGVLGLTLKGKNGGNVGNLSAASSGGASTLNFTNATGDCLTFTGVAYHGAQLVLEDVAVFGNTSGNVLVFNNFSQINFNRVTVSNAGGTTNVTGNGIRFSNTYYVYANALYVWKTGTLYSVGRGITIDMGALSSFLGGLYNFTNCSLYGWYTGLTAGDATPGATANENFASINYTNSELNSNGQGINFLYGVKSASVTGCYIEGNLQLGILVANQSKNVNIQNNFFNNPTASSGDIVLGINGSGTGYTQFYNVDIRDNHFLGVKVFGVTGYAGIGSSLNVEGNYFTLGTAGAVGVNIAQPAPGNLTLTARNNAFYGFAAGSGSMGGTFTVQADNYEFNSAGTAIGAWRQASIVYGAFVSNTAMGANDPDTYVITNTTASARLINVTPAFSRNQRRFVMLTAASTQNLLLYNSAATTLLATLTPGKGAWVWNDGTNEYASVLP